MTLRAGESLAMNVPEIGGSAPGGQPRARSRNHSSMSDKDILERRIARLEERVEELDAFASSVSHDLRAPLRTVTSYARILEEDHSGEMTAAARSCISKILGGTRDMERLIDELLALSRFDTQPITMSLVNTGALVDRVVEELFTPASDRVRLTTGHLGHCLGSVRLLQQVWTNLLSNALKFTRDRNPALIEVGSTTRDRVITYFVRDNGVGFDMESVSEMFLPFRRFHDQRDYEGQGLGLSIAKRIVARHGGRMWAESRRGEGTTFSFTLPRI